MAAGHGGKREAGPDKKIGRPPKAKIELFAHKGIATEVLSMNGPPDHQRICSCKVCASHREAKCKCIKVHDQPLPAECQLYAEHRVCHCETCGWWQGLTAPDKRLRFEVRRYLTDRRDGKPAIGVFAGDTRENRRELDFGDLPDLFPAAGQSKPAGKPN